MADPIDVQEIMRGVRARVRENAAREFREQAAQSTLPTLEAPDWPRLEEAGAALEEAQSLIDQLPPEPRTLRGKAGGLLVKLIRRALSWYTPQIVRFHCATTRSFHEVFAAIRAVAASSQQIWAVTGSLGRRVADLQAETERLEKMIGDQRKGIEELVRLELEPEVLARRALESRLEQELAALSTRFRSAEASQRQSDIRLLQLGAEVVNHNRRISIFLEEARKRLPEAFDEKQLSTFADADKHALDALYVSFEDVFRGTRAEIKGRSEVYLPILKERGIGSKAMPVLDVGCGRGEWLELLSEHELEARGIDINRDLLERCRAAGLNVTEEDILNHLRNQPDRSLGAVTGFHIIEHLPLELLIKVFDETVRVLKPGGLAIFETPNPSNVLVGSHNFYLDFTHRNPLPSLTTQFLLEARGLCDVQILPLHPYPEALRLQDDGTELARRFNEYFYGPQDYALIGRKA